MEMPILTISATAAAGVFLRATCRSNSETPERFWLALALRTSWRLAINIRRLPCQISEAVSIAAPGARISSRLETLLDRPSATGIRLAPFLAKRQAQRRLLRASAY